MLLFKSRSSKVERFRNEPKCYGIYNYVSLLYLGKSQKSDNNYNNNMKQWLDQIMQKPNKKIDMFIAKFKIVLIQMSSRTVKIRMCLK